MALEQFAERVKFTVTNGEHQGMVGALFSRGFHGGKTTGWFNHGGTRMNMDFFERSNHGDKTWLMLPKKNRIGAEWLRSFSVRRAGRADSTGLKICVY
jgi:hypothetical protein